jgi:hypothetical protein
MVNILLNLVVIMVIVAIVYLLFYVFSKYVTPIDSKIVSIVCFIIFALLVIYAFMGHGLITLKAFLDSPGDIEHASIF